MAEQKNSPHEQTNARSAVASGVAGTILPSDLAIPCWVAPRQSPTPFRQAKYSLARKMNLGAKVPCVRKLKSTQAPTGSSVPKSTQAPTGSRQEKRRDSHSENRNAWYNSDRYPPTINPLSVFSAARLSIFNCCATLVAGLANLDPFPDCFRAYRFLNHLLLCRVRGIKWWKLWASSDLQSSQSMAVIRTSFSPMSGSENIPHRTLTIAR